MAFKSLRFLSVFVVLVAPSAFASDQRSGVFFAYSPYFRPEVASSLDSGINSKLELGFRLNENFDFGFGFSNSTANGASYKDAVFGFVPEQDVKHHILNLYGQYNWGLSEAATSILSFLFYIPIRPTLNYTEVNFKSRTANSVGLGATSGIGTKIYTGSVASFDVDLLYHYVFPLAHLGTGTANTPIKNSKGEDVDSSQSGIELRLAFVFLFGL